MYSAVFYYSIFPLCMYVFVCISFQSKGEVSLFTHIHRFRSSGTLHTCSAATPECGSGSSNYARHLCQVTIRNSLSGEGRVDSLCNVNGYVMFTSASSRAAPWICRPLAFFCRRTFSFSELLTPGTKKDGERSTLRAFEKKKWAPCAPVFTECSQDSLFQQTQVHQMKSEKEKP